MENYIVIFAYNMHFLQTLTNIPNVNDTAILKTTPKMYWHEAYYFRHILSLAERTEETKWRSLLVIVEKIIHQRKLFWFDRNLE